MAMALVLMAASIDGFLWQQRVEREQLRAHTRASEASTTRLENQIYDMTRELDELRKRLRTSQRQWRDTLQYCSRSHELSELARPVSTQTP